MRRDYQLPVPLSLEQDNLFTTAMSLKPTLWIDPSIVVYFLGGHLCKMDTVY